MAVRDDLENALLRASALIEAAVSDHRNRSRASGVTELPPDDETVWQTAIRLADQAHRVVLWVLPAGTDCEEVAGVLTTLSSRGARVQVIYAADGLLAQSRAKLLEMAESAVQVRLSQRPLSQLLLVDGRSALLRTEHPHAGPQAVLVQASSVLVALHTLFSNLWSSAAPLAEYLRLDERTRWKMGQQVLTLLSAGYTDDSGARELGTSVRTYRRYVADIMRELGATSRFQAGVRAANLRLLPPLRAGE